MILWKRQRNYILILSIRSNGDQMNALLLILHWILLAPLLLWNVIVQWWNLGYFTTNCEPATVNQSICIFIEKNTLKINKYRYFWPHSGQSYKKCREYYWLYHLYHNSESCHLILNHKMCPELTDVTLVSKDAR